MIRMCRKGLLCLAFGLLVHPALGQNNQEQADVVTLNFVNAPMEGVVKVVSEITGKNFVLDPRVVGTINMVSTQPIPRAQLYETFLAALRLHGYAAVEDRGLVRILPEADAKLNSSPTVGPGATGNAVGDQIQTRVFALQHESAAQLVPVLRPLISPNNTIVAYQNNNTLVITDYANNLQRIAGIIAAIDQPSRNDPVVIPLQHASAVDIAVTVNRLFAEAGVAGNAAEPTQRFTVIADARSNSLLATSGDAARLTRLRDFVALLDTPTNSAGNIHVVYLKNAEAVKLAATLQAIYQGELAREAVAGQPDSPLASIIQADAATNSIIITAPDAIYNTLRAALDKLDVRRAQVYVEALIVEITADRAAEFGVQWQNLSGLGDSGTQAFGGTNFGSTGENIIGVAGNPASVGTGLNVGVVNGSVNIPGLGEVLNLSLLMRALETDGNANILSTPTLLTLDNEEAEIIIGQNVPFLTGQFAMTGSAVSPSPFQTIERHDVGLTLRIKPQISEGGTVRLEIYQEVSSINDKTNPAGVITNKRAVSSMVLVEDGQIVVIGGLIQDSVSDDMQKVPVLGSLPLIGGMFRFQSRSQNKTNLMIFLRPTLVRDSEGADAFTGARYNYILGEQERATLPPAFFLPEFETPQLPPLETGASPAPVEIN